MLINRRTLFALAVSVAFLAVVFWSIDFDEFLDAFAEANYLWLIPAVIVYFLAFTLRAWRWQSLLAHLGGVTLGRSYFVATIGYAANNVLPLRLGEFVRAYLLRRNPGLDMTASLATIAVERILDGLTLLLWLGIGLLFFASTWTLSPLLTLAAQVAAVVFIGAGVAVILAVLFPDAALRVSHTVTRPLPDRYAARMMGIAESLLHGFAALKDARKIPFWFVVSNSVWAGEALVYILVAVAMDVDTPIVVLFVAVAASNLATAVPSSSGGIGPFELLAKETLVRAGVGAGLATAYAVVIHATLWVPVTIAGAVLLILEGVPLREVLRPTSGMNGSDNGQARATE
ncbi:MAG: flippase-like domain-containing protein [Dehalococcoidia bacterium]|nr:flippase-like domain-containing protein [Dehalococcoidia bacterium]